jgi:hypothetical protein
MMLADIVHRQNIRVIEGACGSGFVRESPNMVRIRREKRLQDFDRDIASEPFVASPPDFAEAARTEQPHDGVRA